MIRKADFQSTAVKVTDAIQVRMREWRTGFERTSALNPETPAYDKVDLADYARTYLIAREQKTWLIRSFGLDILGVGLSRVALRLTANWVLKVEYLDADLLGAKHQEDCQGLLLDDVESYDYSQNEREWARWCASKRKAHRKYLAPISHKGDCWLIMRAVEKSNRAPTVVRDVIYDACGYDAIAAGNIGKLNGRYVTCDYGWTSNESGEWTR